MPQTDFIDALARDLRYRGLAFELRDLIAFAEANRLAIADASDVERWAGVFALALQEAAIEDAGQLMCEDAGA